MFHVILVVAAALSFGLKAFNVKLGNIELMNLGFALLTISLLV
jgi:hypothetical protein